jgi:hypothetical protein
MITTIDKETLDFLGKKKLTFNQFCICLLLHEGDISKVIQYTAEVAYLTGGTVLTSETKKVNELDDLVAKGYVKFNWINKDDKWDLDNYAVTEKFTQDFLDKFKIYAKELWDLYPTDMWLNGEPKTVAKIYPYEDYEADYTKLLKTDISVHQKAVAPLKEWRKANPCYAPINLKNYIGVRYWEQLKLQTDERPRPRLL